MARRATYSTYTGPFFSFPRASASTTKAAVVFSVLMTLSNSGIASATISNGAGVTPSSLELSFPSLADFPPPLSSGIPPSSPLATSPDPGAAENHVPKETTPLDDHRRNEHSARSPHKHASLARRLHEQASKTRRTSGSSRATQSASRQIPQKTYTLVDSFEGQSFFDGWDFFNQSDPTHGMITYVDSADAFSSGLAYVTQDNVAVMTVDNTTVLNPGQYRNSVRITSQKSYNNGLFVFDILRGPHGCSVWPAAWLVGPSWPDDGEIDVVEGVHENTFNQMTLHTAAGCTLDTAGSTVDGAVLAAGVSPIELFTGKVLATDCDADVDSNAGCGIVDTDDRSYGAGLNSAGGGVYAVLWNADGVRIWFFSRDSVPADITAQNPDPTTWGSPKSFWSSSSCSQSFFSNMSIVFDIVLGGDWAGATFTSAGCPGTLANYIADPSNFANANWAVNSVRVYQ